MTSKTIRTTIQLSKLLVAFFLLGDINHAFAAGGLSPFDAPITSSADFRSVIERSLKSREQVTTIEAFDAVSFSTQIQTLGNVSFSFNREWRVPDVSFLDNGFALIQLPREGVHLQGEAELRLMSEGIGKSKVRVPAAASILGAPGTTQHLETVFFAGLPGESGHFYKVTADLSAGATVRNARAVRISQQAFQGRTCGLFNSQSPVGRALSVVSSGVPKTSPATYLSFDISTEADYEYYVAYGSGANAKIQAILNQVQTIYQNQLSLTFSLIKQVVVTSSSSRYTSLNVETLLDSFRTYTQSNGHLGRADLYHLFTGKDTYFLDGGSQNYSVIGLAYVGVVCAYPEYAYGLTESFNDALNHITTAHEIGHNFSAEHDAAGSIMGTVLNLNSPPTEFSAFSKNQIASHVAANSSCLTNSDGSANPTPTPTSGGGGTDPNNGDTSHVTLTVSLSNRGVLNASLALDASDASCTATVFASPNSGKVFVGSEVVSASADFSLAQYSNVLVNRRTITSGKKLQKVYLGATKTCGSTVYYSAIKSITPYRIKSSRSGITTRAWIKLLTQQIRNSTPARS